MSEFNKWRPERDEGKKKLRGAGLILATTTKNRFFFNSNKKELCNFEFEFLFFWFVSRSNDI